MDLLPNYPHASRQTAVPLNEHDKEMDKHGTTNPNLHRRMDPADPPKDSEEIKPRDYKFTVAGNDSFRTTHTFIQDDDSDIVEVP